jgi:high-affinity Fe2+/Pb2+ permease
VVLTSADLTAIGLLAEAVLLLAVVFFPARGFVASVFFGAALSVAAALLVALGVVTMASPESNLQKWGVVRIAVDLDLATVLQRKTCATQLRLSRV